MILEELKLLPKWDMVLAVNILLDELKRESVRFLIMKIRIWLLAIWNIMQQNQL